MVIANVSDRRWTADRVLPAGFSYVSQSAWIDEERLLFVGKRESSRGELWELNVTDGSVRRLGIDGLWLRDQIAVSPDRDSTVVSATADGGRVQWNLWRYVLRTRQVTQLTAGNEDEDVDPTWRR